MKATKNQKKKEIRRAYRVRAKVRGTSERPRLSVFRSNAYIYAQVINDETGITLASANSRETKKKGATMESAQYVGKTVAERAKEKGVTKAVFDRGSYRYHGRVKALADAAREAGIQM